MWIKASGRWPGEIEDESGFLAMDVDQILLALAKPDATDADIRVCFCNENEEARPSVEVPMHAAIPYRFCCA